MAYPNEAPLAQDSLFESGPQNEDEQNWQDFQNVPVHEDATIWDNNTGPYHGQYYQHADQQNDGAYQYGGNFFGTVNGQQVSSQNPFSPYRQARESVRESRVYDATGPDGEPVAYDDEYDRQQEQQVD